MGNSKRQKPSESTWRHDIPGTPLELGEHIWLYGYHAVLAALANPQRQKHRLVVTPKTFLETFNSIEPEIMDRSKFDRLLPTGVVHQGIALLTSPLPQISLKNL